MSIHGVKNNFLVSSLGFVFILFLFCFPLGEDFYISIPHFLLSTATFGIMHTSTSQFVVSVPLQLFVW